MSKCITCGAELHPERAAKYNYCMAPECQEKNAKGLTIAVVGMNKAAEEFVILDEQTKADLASGRYHDQRRGSFGTTVTSSAPSPAPAPTAVPEPRPAAPRQRSAAPAAPKVARKPWSQRQQRLALLYNEQGLRPDEIAEKIGLSRYLVTQIILNARTRGKL